MANLYQLQENIQKIANRVELETVIFDEINRYKNVFINLNKKQLSEGESSEGDLFGVYSKATEEIAKTENPRKPKVAGDPYNFEYTGGLFDGFQLIVKDNQAQFWSTDSKTEELVVEYEGLFGLQDDNLKEVISKVIYPAFMIQIRKRLQID